MDDKDNLILQGSFVGHPLFIWLTKLIFKKYVAGGKGRKLTNKIVSHSNKLTQQASYGNLTKQLAVKSIFTGSNCRCLSWIIRTIWKIIGSSPRDHFDENWRVTEWKNTRVWERERVSNVLGSYGENGLRNSFCFQWTSSWIGMVVVVVKGVEGSENRCIKNFTIQGSSLVV